MPIKFIRVQNFRIIMLTFSFFKNLIAGKFIFYFFVKTQFIGLTIPNAKYKLLIADMIQRVLLEKPKNLNKCKKTFFSIKKALC